MVPDPPVWKVVRRFGPPHVCALLPLHAMLQPAFPSEAGPFPFTIESPHPFTKKLIWIYDIIQGGGGTLQHSPPYSVPAYEKPAAEHAV